MNAFPAGPLAANRPNESRELENSGRVLPLARIPLLSGFFGVWILGLPRIVISPLKFDLFRIRSYPRTS